MPFPQIKGRSGVERMDGGHVFCPHVTPAKGVNPATASMAKIIELIVAETKAADFARAILSVTFHQDPGSICWMPRNGMPYGPCRLRGSISLLREDFARAPKRG